MKIIKFLKWFGLSLAIVVLLSGVLPQIATAHQHRESGSVSITFHAQPSDSPVVNQPTQVWVHIEADEQTVTHNQCQNCRLSLLAPDGQLLNRFDGAELVPIAVADHPGAFGATMTFGTVGNYAVRFEGTVDGQSVSQTFSVPVQAAP